MSGGSLGMVPHFRSNHHSPKENQQKAIPEDLSKPQVTRSCLVTSRFHTVVFTGSMHRGIAARAWRNWTMGNPARIDVVSLQEKQSWCSFKTFPTKGVSPAVCQVTLSWVYPPPDHRFGSQQPSRGSLSLLLRGPTRTRRSTPIQTGWAPNPPLREAESWLPSFPLPSRSSLKGLDLVPHLLACAWRMARRHGPAWARHGLGMGSAWAPWAAQVDGLLSISKTGIS